MGELINGRTPEQIRFNVMECAHGHCLSECPYDSSDECTKDLLDDALTLIEHLEAKETTLNTLRDAIYQDAVAHGLWEDTDYTVQLILHSLKLADRTTAYRKKITREWATKIISLEIDELLAFVEYEADYADELADVIIASLSVAGKLGIDIDAAVRRKMEINKGRPWKHGKEEKQC